MLSPPLHITGCILARNEERRIDDALISLIALCDQVIVLDNESEDRTAEIARQYGALVVPVPLSETGTNFDAARNRAIEYATGDWIFYLDADERVPPRLGPILKRLLAERGHEFDGVLLPFKHYFCGKWMQHCNWWPGYTRPQLLKKGRFRYNERLHSGVHVDGPCYTFPADDPDLAIVHYSYDDLHHYLDKLNRYTDGEAENLERDNARADWQAMLAHFVHDWEVYYDHGQAHRDGTHGFVLSFLSGFYRFAARAKGWHRAWQKGQAVEADLAAPISETPHSVEDALRFMVHVARNGAAPYLTARPQKVDSARQLGRLPTEWIAGTTPDVAPPSVGTLAAPIPMPVGKALRKAKLSRETGHVGESRSAPGQMPVVGAVPTPRSGIAACIVARNEASRLDAALQSLLGWVDRIIVVDNESEDDTAAIARRYTPHVLSAPRAAHFEEVRLSVADRIEELAFGADSVDGAACEWLLFLDADERVLPRLGPVLRNLAREHGDAFEGLCLPFRNYFYGKWMQSPVWWPGYKGPQLLKKGTFRFGERIHSGTQVSGRVLQFPADDPDLAIRHDAYETIGQYLEKINRYTDAEAKLLEADGASHSWQAMLAHFVHDWVVHYDQLDARRDGLHGFVQAFLCAFYRFASRAKLWDERRERGEVSPEEAVPITLEWILTFMLRVATEGPGNWLSAPHTALAKTLSPAADSAAPAPIPLLWQGPVFDRSGYAEDGRNLVLALREVGEPVALAADRWASPDAALTDAERSLLESALTPPDTPADLHVANTLTYLLRPSPHAAFNIARTVFETDRLPQGWADRLSAFDRLWVPSRHSRDLFVASGVPADKVAVVPEAISPAFLDMEPDTLEPWPLPGEHTYRFLSVFDWMLHKGWEVLLEAFARAFGDTPEVGLVIKTWSSHGYTWEQIQERADSLLSARVGKRLSDFPNIHLWQADIPASDMPRLYRAANCFVLPTRGEGWCRPLMEAMAMGLPTIATGWSGHTDYHDEEVGYPLRYTVEPVSDAGAREVPFYAGHQWAEPEMKHLQQLLRQVHRYPKAARKKGAAARERIAERYSRATVGERFREEISACRVFRAAKQRAEATARGTEQPAQRQQSEQSHPPLGQLPQQPPAQRNAILLQCAAGEHVAFLELTQPRHTGYAAHHDMDFVCQKGPLQNERAATWEKILLIRRFLKESQYEHLICLDADTLIVDFARDLRAALPPHAWLGMVLHTNERGSSWFNAGAIYVRNTPEAHAFFEEVWQAWPIEHHWEDNLALIWVLACEPARWANGVVRIDDAWNSTRLMNPTERPVVMGWHGNGTVSERFQMIRGVLEAVERLERGERDNRALWETLVSMGTPQIGPAIRHRLSNAAPQAAPMVLAADKAPRPGASPSAGQTGHIVPVAPQRRPPLRPRANPVPLDGTGMTAGVPLVDFPSVLGRPLRLVWEGDQRILSSLAHVNREIGLRLLEAGDVDLSLRCHPGTPQSLPPDIEGRFATLLARRDAPLSGPPDVTVRHYFPPNWHQPAAGKLIVMQPWELSHLPNLKWLEGATQHAAEVWAYSRFVRDIYVRSGVPGERIRVVPLGVRTDVFTPEGPVYPLPPHCAAKTTRFLFVGGALDRKGADLLLEAYLRAFQAQDDVCLIVKDMGTRTFYQGATLKKEFLRAQHNANGPSIFYLDDDLSEKQLASLYRACTCVVLPYRGEGFGLSPLEGMACGKSAIVTAGGPTDDYLDDSMALRVPYHRRFHPGIYNEPDGFPVDPWDTEPDREALLEALRWVYERPEETAERGRAGRQHVLNGWTWERTVAIAREGLSAVVAPSPKKQAVAPPAVTWISPRSAVETPVVDAVSPQGKSKVSSGRSRKKAKGPDGAADMSSRAIELSLCVIARDEEARLGKCLESIRPFVDEMIVVDTGSRDRTREIAAEQGARVFDFPWTDSFAEARNQSLTQARGQWIFWMDADDVISPECGKQLKEIIRRHPDRMAAYQVQVRIPPGEGEFSETLVDHVKLFPNRPDIRFEHRIHEQILPSLRRAGIPVLFSDLFVTHRHYDRSPAGQTRKRIRDFRLLEMDLKDHPHHPFVLFNLGMTHLYATREFEAAAHYLRRSLDGSHPRDSIVRKAYGLLTTARMCQFEWEQALQSNEEGRRHYVDDAELLYQAGQVYQQVGLFDEAKAALERLVGGSDDPHYRSVDVGLRTYKGWHELALLYARMGDTPHAVTVLEEVVRNHPHYRPAQEDLFFIRNGRMGSDGQAV